MNSVAAPVPVLPPPRLAVSPGQRNGRLHLDPLEVIARTGTAAFASDETGRIVIWNKGAEELLGYHASRVLGKACHEILGGMDVFGNRFCNQRCALTCMAERHETVRHFELDVRSESGQIIPASISILVIPGPRAGQYRMVHSIERVDRRRDISDLIRQLLTERHAPAVWLSAAGAPTVAPQPALTSRELQILRLLAEGTSTQDIADSLFISVTTTRNHIQNILSKLGVHSKLEAVSLALRTRLL